MLKEKLKNHQLILSSGSPRRQQFLKDLGLEFEIRPKPVKEVYPEHLKGAEIPDFLARLKADAFSDLKPHEIVITGDTMVFFEGRAMGKPKDEKEAFAMLGRLSGKHHEVISSICVKSFKTEVAHAITKVYFKEFTQEEILYYVKAYKPFDKAGAYGIQEWIGQIGATKIEGSYFNVMGMPTHLLYSILENFTDR